MRHMRTTSALLAALGLLASSCTSNEASTSPAEESSESTAAQDVEINATEACEYTARPAVRVWVDGVDARTLTAELVDGEDVVADSDGSDTLERSLLILVPYIRGSEFRYTTKPSAPRFGLARAVMSSLRTP